MGQILPVPATTCQIDATGNGSFAFEYWAVSSHGDTSYKGNTTITVDKEAPVVGLNLSGSMGYNSWYVSGVNWTTSLTDSVSGPSHVNVSVDGASQSNPGSYATDGTHTIKALVMTTQATVAKPNKPYKLIKPTPYPLTPSMAPSAPTAGIPAQSIGMPAQPMPPLGSMQLLPNSTVLL